MPARLPLAQQIRERLLAWYRASCRDLPWRRTRDPYRIWLSETMLQQTRVETVVPYYERFIERFPCVEALACADEEDVLREWAGLGYYARARNLKRAAEQIVRHHGGRLPRDAQGLAALPGVGPYTVGAIRSIAFREPAAIVDGNIERVLSRLLARRKMKRAELWRLAGQLVPSRRPDLFNQALMELGATLCTARSPRCESCPISGFCQGFARGRAEAYPVPKRKAPPEEVKAVTGALQRRGRLLLLRRPSRGLLGGLWETPMAESERALDLIASLHDRTGLRTRVQETLGQLRHVFTHRALTLDVVRLTPVSGRLCRDSHARWCTPREIQDLPLSTLMRKTLRLAGLNLPGPRPV